MKISLKIQSFLFTLLLALSAASCGSHRAQMAAVTAVEPVIAPAPDINSVAASAQPWTDLTAPVRLDLQAPSRLSASGTAKMVYCQALAVSVRVLGMEMANIYADNDSILITVRLYKTAYAESMDRLAEATGMNLADVQCLVLGQPFVPGFGPLNAGNRDMVEQISADGDSIAWSYSLQGLDWLFEAVGPVPMGLSRAEIADQSGTISVAAQYSGTEATDGGAVAQTVDLRAQARNTRVNASLRWNTDRAEWNRGITVSRPRIPANYRRITTENLINYLRASGGR